MVEKDYEASKDQDKNKRYQHVLNSFKSLADVFSFFTLKENNHPFSNISNFIALLKEEFNWWWIGFYFVSQSKKDDLLLLGPFQGPLACTQIKKGKGVCGSSWKRQESIIVQDVDKFQGHIACSSQSKSEIVIPLFCDKKVIGVLDIDSEKYAQFDQTDDKYLKEMLNILGDLKAWKWIDEKF